MGIIESTYQIIKNKSNFDESITPDEKNKIYILLHNDKIVGYSDYLNIKSSTKSLFESVKSTMSDFIPCYHYEIYDNKDKNNRIITFSTRYKNDLIRYPKVQDKIQIVAVDSMTN